MCTSWLQYLRTLPDGNLDYVVGSSAREQAVGSLVKVLIKLENCGIKAILDRTKVTA